MSRIKEAVGITKEEEYTPERAEGLRNAKAMAQDRENYYRDKAEFEREQAEKKPLRKILRAVNRFGKSFEPKPNLQRTQTLTRSFTGRSLPVKYQGRKGYSGRGRPRGSVKYFIPGVGSVGVYQYRKWISQLKQQKRQVYEAQMQAIMQNPQLAQAYAEGRISPQVQQENIPYNAPQSTINPQSIQYAPPQNQNPLFGGFNALKVQNPFPDIERDFMGGVGRRKQI